MARVKGPLFSNSAHGAVGKTIIFTSGKQGKNVTFMHRPGGSPSLSQIAVRDNFSAAKSAWNDLTTEQKEEYNTRAFPLKLTGYNLFISEFEPDMLKRLEVTLNNADILAIAAVPFEVFPSPGVGKYYNVLGIDMITDFTGGAYTLEAGSTKVLSFYMGPDRITEQYVDSEWLFEDDSDVYLTRFFPWRLNDYGTMVYDNLDNAPILLRPQEIDISGGGNAANYMKLILYYTLENF